jgi:ADP-heptose:LPS heptosyltransferase
MTILISKVNQLGDNVVFLPVVQQLRSTFPDARLVVVTSPVAAPLYERCVERVEVLKVPTKEFNQAWRSPLKLIRMARQWRAHKPDAVLVANDQGNVAHFLAGLSGARYRVGPENEEIKTHWMLNLRSEANLLLPIAMQNWRIAQMLCAELGASIPDRPPCPDLLRLVGPVAVQPEVVIHPGASRAYQRWPLDRFVELATALSTSNRVCWIDEGSQVELPGQVQRVKPNDLASFVSLLAGTRLFVGNNSGPMHIASALGVPGVIPIGPSTPCWDPYWHNERFVLLRDRTLTCQPCDRLSGPVNVCQNTVSPMVCMKRWSVDEVLSKCLEQMNISNPA